MGKVLPSTVDGGKNFPTNNAEEPVYTKWGKAGFVPLSREIITGKGLSGGGDLASNLTLCVNFGSEEDTVVEGNDPRLSDGRDWTAALVTQDEAREGISEEPKKWSAKFVRTAIEGWWAAEGISVEEGATKNKSDDYLLDRQFHTGTQPISSIIGLEEALSSNSNSSINSTRTPIKPVNMNTRSTYLITPEDIGNTIIFESLIDKLDIIMPFCFGKLGDEVYFIAPKTFNSNYPDRRFTFYSEIEETKVYPKIAGNLYPTFREGRSIVCLKKIYSCANGMANWILFGDLLNKKDVEL